MPWGLLAPALTVVWRPLDAEGAFVGGNRLLSARRSSTTIGRMDCLGHVCAIASLALPARRATARSDACNGDTSKVGKWHGAATADDATRPVPSDAAPFTDTQGSIPSLTNTRWLVFRRPAAGFAGAGPGRSRRNALMDRENTTRTKT